MLTSLLVEAGTELPSVRHVILTGDATPLTLLAQLPGPFTERALLQRLRLHGDQRLLRARDRRRAARPGAPGRAAARRAPPDRRERSRGRGRRRGRAVGLDARSRRAGYLGAPSSDDGFGADGFYRTRDLVRRDASGELFLEGRTDSQVKVRGVRVNLQAVEQALLGDETIVEAAVFAVEEALAGRRLIAVVRRGDGAEPDTLEAARALRARAGADRRPGHDRSAARRTAADRHRQGGSQRGAGQLAERRHMNHHNTIAQFIVDEFAPDLRASQIDTDYDLLEGGIIDSLGLLTIVAWIEDRFGVAVDAGEIGEDDLRTRAVDRRADRLRDGRRSRLSRCTKPSAACSRVRPSRWGPGTRSGSTSTTGRAPRDAVTLLETLRDRTGGPTHGRRADRVARRAPRAPRAAGCGEHRGLGGRARDVQPVDRGGHPGRRGRRAGRQVRVARLHAAATARSTC